MQRGVATHVGLDCGCADTPKIQIGVSRLAIYLVTFVTRN